MTEHSGAGDVIWRQWHELNKILDVLAQVVARCDEGLLSEPVARRALVTVGLEAASDESIPWEDLRVMAEDAKRVLYRVRDAIRAEAVQATARARRRVA